MTKRTQIFFATNIYLYIIEMQLYKGAWVAQSVKCLTLNFGSGHDLTGHEFKPCVGLCADSEKPAWDSLSLSAPPQLVHALCLSQSK